MHRHPTNIVSLSDIPAEAQAEIQRRLAEIETEHQCQILLAIESGSRAWGFPSPDSDYDVRFIYSHRPEWYLSIDERKDVIEMPIELPYDINGWDLKKALHLLRSANPVLLEWLQSPIHYRWSADFANDLLALSRQSRFANSCLHHYFHLAASQYRRYIEGRPEVPLKKYFYVMRPALALLWVRTRPSQLPPMTIQSLMQELHLPDRVREFLLTLIERKRATHELGSTAPIPEIDEFIRKELEHASAGAGETGSPGIDIDEANVLFRKWIGDFGRQAR